MTNRGFYHNPSADQKMHSTVSNKYVDTEKQLIVPPSPFNSITQYQKMLGNRQFGQYIQRKALTNKSNFKPVYPDVDRASNQILQRAEKEAFEYATQAELIEDPENPPETIEDFIQLLKQIAPYDRMKYSLLRNNLLWNLSDTVQANILHKLKGVLGPTWGTLSKQDFPEVDDEDEEYMLDQKYESKLFKKPIRKFNFKKKKRDKLINGKIETNFKHKNKLRGELKRNKAYGNVTITNQVINHIVYGELERPTHVQGFIEPTETKGRPNAPEPSSDYQVGVKMSEVGTRRNTGIVDAQKGHIMALELGGPDISRNIVPQWGNWQGNGVWRQAEKQALKLAEEAEARGNKLWFHTEVLYKTYTSLVQASHRGFSFPIGFTMTVQEKTSDGQDFSLPTVIFDDKQAQDQTDQKMAYRVMDQVDENEASYSDDEDSK